MLLISHDRYFISQVATTICALENKQLELYSGDYKVRCHAQVICIKPRWQELIHSIDQWAIGVFRNARIQYHVCVSLTFSWHPSKYYMDNKPEIAEKVQRRFVKGDAKLEQSLAHLPTS